MLGIVQNNSITNIIMIQRKKINNRKCILYTTNNGYILEGALKFATMFWK